MDWKRWGRALQDAVPGMLGGVTLGVSLSTPEIGKTMTALAGGVFVAGVLTIPVQRKARAARQAWAEAMDALKSAQEAAHHLAVTADVVKREGEVVLVRRKDEAEGDSPRLH